MTMSSDERAAYDYYLRQLYEATMGVMLAGAVSTGDTTPALVRPWTDLTLRERQHFSRHLTPQVVNVLGRAVYCVNGLKDGQEQSGGGS